MTRFFPLALLLTLHVMAPAQAPRMTVRGNDGAVKLLQVEQAEVSVRIFGDVAETVLDLNFRNDSDRAVEGEFVLPLPEGATVCAYALEVNGKLRDGVAVEKERARTAYETVKRRMIDPGIVERESGNVYRTKVYPVPAKGTKRLRISYNETLRLNGQGFGYSLPLDFPDSLNSFSCELRGAGIQVRAAAGLSFTANADDCLKSEIGNGKPGGTLKLTVPSPDGPQMMVEDEAQPAFTLSARPLEITPRPRPSPDSVMLVWDASASGAERDHAKELVLLDSWFAKLGRTRVKLRVLRDRLVDGGEFEIRGGRWAELKKALQQVDYDGATDLSRIQVSTEETDLVVLISDGVSTLGSAAPKIPVPWIFLHSGKNAPSKSLARQAEASGGAAIPLTTDDLARSLRKLTHQTLRLSTVVGSDVRDVFIDQSAGQGQPVRVYGTLAQSRAGKLELRYGYGKEIISTTEVTYQPGGNRSGTIRRLHAQRALAELELENPPDRKRIIEHCKKHGLVSDFTSLIVLERIEDYAEHQIPPPEPELQEEYRRLVELRARQRSSASGDFAQAWSARLKWYGQEFPGHVARILPRLRQVGIWKKAVDSQFAPAQRDAKAYEAAASWFERGMKAFHQRRELRTEEDYNKWIRSIDELHTQWPTLAQKPVQPPPAGQPLAVSVRGLVVNPGLVTGESGMTLKQAIQKAGGVHPMGKLDSVALYRNAGKIVYNTLSEQYQDVALFPGDMLVVSRPMVSSSCFDGFSAAPGPDPDPRKAPAVSEAKDLWVERRSEDNAFSRGLKGQASIPGVAEESVVGEVVVRELPRIEVDDVDFKAFEAAIAAKGDPEAAYQKLKVGKIYQPKFYLEAARILFGKNHLDLARRVLSNLVEWRPGDVAALREYALWLAEFGQAGEAEAVLLAISKDVPAGLEARLDLASIRAIRGESLPALEALHLPLDVPSFSDSGSFYTIAMTEIYALYEKPSPERSNYPQLWEDYRRKNLPADIRIVLSAASGGGGLGVTVKEPGGLTSSDFSGTSEIGGQVTAFGGTREYMIRHAVPGIYQVTCTSGTPTTVRCVIHTDWGRPNQQSRVVTAWLDSHEIADLGDIRFEFREKVK
jgi:hypothetical protein